jgi:hypothetical protein
MVYSPHSRAHVDCTCDRMHTGTGRGGGEPVWESPLNGGLGEYVFQCKIKSLH